MTNHLGHNPDWVTRPWIIGDIERAKMAREFYEELGSQFHNLRRFDQSVTWGTVGRGLWCALLRIVQMWSVVWLGLIFLFYFQFWVAVFVYLGDLASTRPRSAGAK